MNDEMCPTPGPEVHPHDPVLCDEVHPHDPVVRDEVHPHDPVLCAASTRPNALGLIPRPQLAVILIFTNVLNETDKCKHRSIEFLSGHSGQTCAYIKQFSFYHLSFYQYRQQLFTYTSHI